MTDRFLNTTHDERNEMPELTETTQATTNPEDTTPSTPSEVAEETQPTADPDDDQDEPKSPNAEAAKWRTKFRAAEQERDRLAARITGIEQTVIHHAIVAAGIDPRLWELSSIDLDELRGDDGYLDVRAVNERALDIRREVYGAGPKPNPQQGNPSRGPATSGIANYIQESQRQN